MPETARVIAEETLEAILGIRLAIVSATALEGMSWSSLTANLAEVLACRAFHLLRLQASESRIDALSYASADVEELTLADPPSSENVTLFTSRGIQIKAARNRNLTSVVRSDPFAHLYALQFDEEWIVRRAWRMPLATVEYLLGLNRRDGKNDRKLRFTLMATHAVADESVRRLYPIEDVRLALRAGLPEGARTMVSE